MQELTKELKNGLQVDSAWIDKNLNTEDLIEMWEGVLLDNYIFYNINKSNPWGLKDDYILILETYLNEWSSTLKAFSINDNLLNKVYKHFGE